MSPFILTIWSKSTISNTKFSDIESMFNFIFVFRIKIKPWAKKIICKEKHMINRFKTSSQLYETVESFPYVFLVTVPSTLLTKSKLHRLYWPPFTSIRDCYGEIFSSTFLEENLEFLLRSTHLTRRKTYFSGSVPYTKFTILLILFFTCIM